MHHTVSWWQEGAACMLIPNEKNTTSPRTPGVTAMLSGSAGVKGSFPFPSL